MTQGDDDVLMRFLIGELSDAERERVEDRVMHEPEFFEALCALEHDTLVSYLRNELAEPWRTALEARLAESPSLRHELESVRTLQAALANVAPRRGRAQPVRGEAAAVSAAGMRTPAAARTTWVTRAARWLSGGSPPRAIWAVGAAAAVVIAAGIWWRGAPNDAARPAAGTTVSTSGATVPSFFLEPATRAAGAPASTSFRIPASADRIGLRLAVPATSVDAAEASVRPVGGAPLPIAGTLTLTRDQSSLAISWTVPARDLPPGDYILTIVDRTAAAGPPIASRYFSVLP